MLAARLVSAYVASHIRTESAADVMIGLANRGAALEIFADSTFRRVTAKVEQRLAAARIQFKRIRNPEHLPMHLKFVLVEDHDKVWSFLVASIGQNHHSGSTMKLPLFQATPCFSRLFRSM